MIKFRSTIRKLERHRRVKSAYRSYPIGDPRSDVIAEYEDLGWALLLDGSMEWLFIGQEDPPPKFKAGAAVTVTIEVD